MRRDRVLLVDIQPVGTKVFPKFLGVPVFVSMFDASDHDVEVNALFVPEIRRKIVKFLKLLGSQRVAIVKNQSR